MKYLIVVDMQVDFITGNLGSEHAIAIVPTWFWIFPNTE